jgi:hypothetical protein
MVELLNVDNNIPGNTMLKKYSRKKYPGVLEKYPNGYPNVTHGKKYLPEKISTGVGKMSSAHFALFLIRPYSQHDSTVDCSHSSHKRQSIKPSSGRPMNYMTNS